MAQYEIFWKLSAKKELKKIDKRYIKKIIDEVEVLSNNPYPKNHKKLIGSKNLYRIRINDYRVVYKVEDERLIIEIIRVKHRKDVYR
jgi:mRNA interferase RelE/StbE